MDLLGKGSVIGTNSILLKSTWVYAAKISSKRANICMIDLNNLQHEISETPFLKQEVDKYMEILQLSVPNIDYLCRLDLICPS